MIIICQKWYIELRNTGCQYELVGVITNIGMNSTSGRFIAYCKSYWDNKWYKYADVIFVIFTPVTLKSQIIYIKQ